MVGQFGLQTVAMLLELTLGADFMKTKRFIQAMFSVVRQDSTHRGSGASSQTGDSLVFLAEDEECQDFQSLERPRIDDDCSAIFEIELDLLRRNECHASLLRMFEGTGRQGLG